MTIQEKLEAIVAARANRLDAARAEVEAVNRLFTKLSPTDKCLEHGQFAHDLDPDTHLVYARSGELCHTFKEFESS